MRALVGEVPTRRVGAQAPGVPRTTAVLVPAENLDGCLLRFLRARQFNVPKALSMVEAHVKWRNDYEVAGLKHMRPSDILGCDERVVHYFLPSLQEGFDLQGRPVQWAKQGALYYHELIKHAPRERLIRYHIWQQRDSWNAWPRVPSGTAVPLAPSSP